MKKIVASVGLVAIGASGLQTVSAQQVGAPDATKPWSVSATLRGFYDDNTATLPDDAVIPANKHRDSFGYEVSPSAALLWSAGQTTANLGFLYSYKYYENTPINSDDHADQSFTFNAGLNHAFTERTQVRVSDSFVIGQEPDLLRAGNVYSTFQRVSGDNIRNYGSIALDHQFAPKLGMNVGYDNGFFDYDESGPALAAGSSGFEVSPSISGTLNRLEHRAHLEGNYLIQPETKGLFGMQFTEIDYTSDQIIGGQVISPVSPITPSNVNNAVYADQRNSRQYTPYIGVEHNFSPQLSTALRAGASYTDYFNDPSMDATWTPYFNATVKYAYAPESSVSGGFSYDRSATDVVGYSGANSFALDAESAVVFASVKHRLLPNLFGSVLAQFQNSSYKGGVYDGENEQYYILGLDLEYRFNQYLSSHVGYNFDYLDSDLDRSFDRNRVYIGVTATY